MLWLNILLLILSIPIGYLIAYLARDELVMYRKYFKVLMIVGIIGVIGFRLYGFIAESWTMGFMLIVVLISLVLSNNERFLKNGKI